MKKKKRLGKILGAIMPMIIGGIFGAMLVLTTGGLDGLDEWMHMGVILILLFVTGYLQIIIHEGGHLIFGLCSGYEFLSYRVGQFIWYKDGDTVKFGRYKVAGTGGQCLLKPSEQYSGDIPYLLYHMGGSMANIITAVLAIGLHFVVGDAGIFSDGLLVFSGVGLLFAVLNGIPMALGGMPNDGMNVWNVKKRKSTHYHLWVQMQIVGKMSEGVRMSEMPEAWFQMPAIEEMDNGLSAAIGVMAVGRDLDNHNYQAVREKIEYLMDDVDALISIHHSGLACELIFLELIGDCDREKIDALYTKAVKQFVKAMGTNPGVVRMEYAYALRYLKDEKIAEKKLVAFEKAAKNYPYSGDVLLERELLEELDRAVKLAGI